jgi:hypothetical protein
MITISTTSPGEARIAADLLRQTALDYRVYLLGRQVVARVGGSAEVMDAKVVSRLPDFAAHHPGNCPPGCLEHR